MRLPLLDFIERSLKILFPSMQLGFPAVEFDNLLLKLFGQAEQLVVQLTLESFDVQALIG